MKGSGIGNKNASSVVSLSSSSKGSVQLLFIPFSFYNHRFIHSILLVEASSVDTKVLTTVSVTDIHDLLLFLKDTTLLDASARNQWRIPALAEGDRPTDAFSLIERSLTTLTCSLLRSLIRR